MAHVVCITNQKGGVTKTTTSGVLAFLLGKMGYKVLAIDFEPQANLTQFLMQVDDVQEELLDTKRAQGTGFEAVVISDVSPFVVENVLGNVDLLISSNELANITSFLYSEDWNGHISEGLRTALDPVQDEYDFILVDSPPTLGELLTNAIGAADSVIIPVDPSRYSKSALRDSFVTIEKLQASIDREIKILGILPTIINKKRKESAKLIGYLETHEVYKKFLLPTQIVNKAAIGRLSETGFVENVEILDEIDPYLPVVEEMVKYGK